MIHATNIRDLMGNATVSAVNANTGNASGRLRFRDINGNILAIFILQNPAFGACSGGQATLNQPANTSALLSGEIHDAVFLDRAGNTVMTGTVTVAGAGGDFETTNSSKTVIAGETIALNQFIYKAPL